MWIIIERFVLAVIVAGVIAVEIPWDHVPGSADDGTS